MSTEDKVKLNSVEEGAQVNVQSDWNQLNETAPDAILNKPFGEYETVAELLAETEVTGAESTESDGFYLYTFDINPFTGNEEEVTVTFDGIKYVCNKIVSTDDIFGFGNVSFSGTSDDDTGEPFFVIANMSQNACVMVLHDLNPHTISISEVNVNIKAIDPKYLPEGYPYEEVTAIEFDAFGEHNIPLALGQVWEVSYDAHGTRKYDTHEVQVSDDGTLYLSDLTLTSDTPYYITATGYDYNSGWYRMMDITNVVVTCVSGTVTETIIHPMDEKFLPSSATAQSDWSVNDENDPAYVKNRTHYDSREIVSTILEGASADLPEASYELNKEYKIQFGDTEYTCEIQSFYLSPVACDMYYLGGNHWGGDGYSEYPFSIVIGKSTESIENIAATINVPEAPASPITVSILLGGELKHLDPKYIKDMYHEESSELFSIENAEFVNGEYFCETPFVITDGNTYIVNWDGTEYTCAAYTFGGLPVIGNTLLFGGTGNGEPFFIVYDNEANVNFIAALNDSIDGSTTTHTVSVIENVVHTIDHKYIKDMYYSETVLQDVEYYAGGGYYNNGANAGTFDPIPLALGDKYQVYYSRNNGELQLYSDEWFEVLEDDMGLYIGNPNFGTYPFCIRETITYTHSAWNPVSGPVTEIRIKGQIEEEIVHQIDEKFIPDTIQRKLTGVPDQIITFDENGNTIAKNVESENEALELLAELEVIVPVSDGDSVLTDEHGNIFII